MKKYAESSVSLNPVLAERWSPRAFDVQHEISTDDLTGILEAARWSPSANNLQPWRFLVGKRNDENFKAFSSTLSGFNTEWAPNASAMILVCAYGNPVTKDEIFDSGLAVGSITFQIYSMGLFAHQMAGFSKNKIKELDIDDDLKNNILKQYTDYSHIIRDKKIFNTRRI